MLYPSIDALQEKIVSKYTLVTIASKRAREIQEGDTRLLTTYKAKKDVGQALEEVAAGVLTKKQQDESIIYEDEI